jgi:hypothetical protein
MIVVLMVMSSMDPHTIRVTWIGMVELLGVGQSCLLGRATTADSMVFDVASRGEELLPLVIAAWHRMQPSLSASLKPQSAFPCLKPSCHDFPPLAV